MLLTKFRDLIGISNAYVIGASLFSCLTFLSSKQRLIFSLQEYNLEVTLKYHKWTVPARYKHFEKLHNEVGKFVLTVIAEQKSGDKREIASAAW